ESQDDALLYLFERGNGDVVCQGQVGKQAGDFAVFGEICKARLNRLAAISGSDRPAAQQDASRLRGLEAEQAPGERSAARPDQSVHTKHLAPVRRQRALTV